MKILFSALKILYKQIEAYHTKSFFFSGVNTFWLFQNNEVVLAAIKKLNTKRASSNLTFDFSILYTNIMHNNLKHEKKKEVLDFCFKDKVKILQLPNMV